MMKKILGWVGALCVLVLASVAVYSITHNSSGHGPGANGSSEQGSPANNQARRESGDTASAAIPDQAYETLKKIDAGTWPASGTTGTKGGTVWQNREHRLPAQDSSGRPVAYKEWDVNNKIPGHNRDAERIITGSDHSAWYTGDHYLTFERMR